MSNARSWKPRGTKPATCNAFPDVWGAMLGCTGAATLYRGGRGHFGSASTERACPCCAAAKDRLDRLQGPAHAQALRDIQRAAGVEDYRTAETVRENGRPYLVVA